MVLSTELYPSDAVIVSLSIWDKSKIQHHIQNESFERRMQPDEKVSDHPDDRFELMKKDLYQPKNEIVFAP